MKQLIKYFLSFFSQHVELEQTIENLQQELCDLKDHAARLQYEYEWANKQSCEKGELAFEKSKLADDKSNQLDYANIVIGHLSSEISELQDKFFNEFCRANQAEESMSVGEYSSKYFKKIFKNYKSKSEIKSLSIKELQSIYFDCGFGNMVKFRNELSVIQKSKAVKRSDDKIRSLDILCRKKLILKDEFWLFTDEEIAERLNTAI